MGEDLIKNLLNINQSLSDLSMTSILDSDELIVENNDDIDLKTEYPYLIFNRNDLVRAMNLVSKLIKTKSEVSDYNSISFVPVSYNKKILFYATNDLSHFRMSTELLGEPEEFLKESFSIPLIVLQKLVKLMGNKVLIYKKESFYYIRLLDGDLLLDTRPINEKIIFFPGEVQDKIAELSLSGFGSIVNSILPLLNSEIKGESKKILFTGEKAYYNSSFYYIEAKLETPKISLSLNDSEFINKLYKYYRDKSILLFNVKSDVPRLFLKLDNIEYQFINSNSSMSTLMTQQMNNIIKNIECMMNYDRFNKIITLATSLPNSTGNINLAYDDNKLKISIVSIKGDSNFNLSIDKEEDVTLYNKPVLINASTLKRLLSSFGNAEKIGIALGDKSTTFEYRNIKAIIMNLEN